MHRVLVLIVAVAGMSAGARAQEHLGVEQGFVGPIVPSESAPAGGEPAAGERSGRIAAPAEIESRPLGGQAEPPARMQFARDKGEREAQPGASLRAGEGWWRTAGSLAIILAIIFLLALGVRRWATGSGGLVHAMGAGGRAPSGVLSVLGRYPVGRGQTLVLLKLDRRVLLVCQSAGAKGGGMRTLCELTDPEEVASVILHAGDAEGRTLSARFREMVSSFESSHGEAEAVLRPVEVSIGRVPEADADPADLLHSRLDTLRRRELGVSA